MCSINDKSPEPSNEIIRIIFYTKVYVILCLTLIIKSRDASIILIPTLKDNFDFENYFNIFEDKDIYTV